MSKTMGRILVAISLIIIVGLVTLTYGPLDKVPRLRVTANSPDSRFKVSVWEKRFSLIPSKVGIIVTIHKADGKLLYESKIFEDGWWYEDIGEMYKEVKFRDRYILVGPKYSPEEYFLIDTGELPYSP